MNDLLLSLIPNEKRRNFHSLDSIGSVLLRNSPNKFPSNGAKAGKVDSKLQ